MSIPCPLPASQSMLMFQEVLGKSFQIIKTILPRTNSLFQLNEQLERSVSNLQRKLMRLQLDNDSLHYQLRTNNLALENKINNLTNQFGRINNQANFLKKQSEMLVKSVKEVKHIQNHQKKDQDENQNHMGNVQQKTRKIIFQDQVKIRQKQTKKNSIQISQEQSQQFPKVHFNLHSNASIQYSQRSQFNSQISINRKSNLKQIKNKQNFISSKNLKKKQDIKYEQFLKEIQKYHHDNQAIKKNYQKLIDTYCQQNEQQFKILHEKINQIYKKIDFTVEGKVYAKELTKLQTISSNNQNKNIEGNNSKYIDFDKILNSTVTNEVFEASIKEMNVRLAALHQIVHKFANREQTKRAIICLQNKINTIFEEQINNQVQKKRSSVHYVEIDQKGCLRVNCNVEEKLETNHKKHIRHSQTLENTQRTRRNGQIKQKRLIGSLHSKTLNGAMTENRFNEQRRSLFIERQSKGEQEYLRSNEKTTVKGKQISILKQKSVQILQKTKVKPRQKLKKQRLIFQYD